jgi:Flp pilus assembly protein TadD
MNARRYLTIAASALVLGAPLVGGPAMLGGLAIAGSKADTVDARKAAKSAKDARKALAKKKAQLAVTLAEAAVAYDPKNGEYRKLLGETYLFAGRFVSAAQALGEALTLDPANGRTALNLALAQIANGEWTTARETLETHAATIPASDRGLAFALAGDPATAVELLSDAARQPGADAKTRQNLALSLALAGQWQQAKAVAAVDLPADQVDARIMQWASFSRPQNAYDQVAALLNVTPIADRGQPERLALARWMSVAVAAQQVASPVDNFMPGATAVDTAAATAEPAPAEVGSVAAVEIAAPAVTASGGTQIVFAERKEVVQAVPAPVATPVRVAAVKPAAEIKTAGSARVLKAEPATFTQSNGQWFVQLGAYDSAGVAREAWGRAVKRVPALQGLTPSSASVTTKVGAFERLAVGGLSRADATALCGKVRASGGSCFVRTGAGDKTASWAKGQRVASR